MASFFDTRPNIFSTGGHLDQVEYAMEAVASSGRIIGIRARDGILLVAENLHYDQLMDTESLPSKIHRINKDHVCAITGIASDGFALLEKMQLYANQFFLRFQRSVPCENLVQHICTHKQASTHFTGSRPYGVSILFPSWSPRLGYELFHTSPSGDYTSWRAVCVGKLFNKVNVLLKKKIMFIPEESLTLNDAKKIAAECFCETTDPLNTDMIEMATMERKNDKNVVTFLPADELKTVFASIVTVRDLENDVDIEMLAGINPADADIDLMDL